MLINNKSKFNNSLNFQSLKGKFKLYKESVSFSSNRSSFIDLISENLNQFTVVSKLNGVRSEVTAPLTSPYLIKNFKFELPLCGHPTLNYQSLALRTSLNLPVIADQDFKVWDSLELLEDVTSDLNLLSNYAKPITAVAGVRKPLNYECIPTFYSLADLYTTGRDASLKDSGGPASLLQASSLDSWVFSSRFTSNNLVSSVLSKVAYITSVPGSHSTLKLSKQLLIPSSLNLKLEFFEYPQTLNYSQKLLN